MGSPEKYDNSQNVFIQTSLSLQGKFMNAVYVLNRPNLCNAIYVLNRSTITQLESINVTVNLTPTLRSRLFFTRICKTQPFVTKNKVINVSENDALTFKIEIKYTFAKIYAQVVQKNCVNNTMCLAIAFWPTNVNNH
jgi:hypothetical protein